MVSIGAGGAFANGMLTAGGPTQVVDTNNVVLVQAGGGGAGQNGTDATSNANGTSCSNGFNGFAGAGGLGGSGTNVVGRNASGGTPPAGSIALPPGGGAPGAPVGGAGYALLTW